MTESEEARKAPKTAPAAEPVAAETTPKRKKVNIDIAVDD